VPGWDSAPQANSRVSNINFVIWIFWGLYISHEKLPKDGKVLSHSGFKSKIFSGPLTDLITLVDSVPQAHSRISNINFVIWILGGLYISHGKMPNDGTVLSHLGFRSEVLHAPSTDLSAWVGFCTSSPQQGVKY